MGFLVESSNFECTSFQGPYPSIVDTTCTYSGWLLESIIKTLLVLPSNQVEALSKQDVLGLADNQSLIDSGHIDFVLFWPNFNTN